MLKPVHTQKDFREGKVGIRFEGNMPYLSKIIRGLTIDFYPLVNHLIAFDGKEVISVASDKGDIPFVPEHEIYLAGTDIPKDEKGLPLRFWGGKDNSDDVTSSEYYLIYQKKNCILSAIKSDNFMDLCMKLKIAKVKEKHIVEHNLSSDSLEKAFRFILPPKKKIGFRKFSLDLLENTEVRQKALKADELGLGFKFPPIELQGVANIAKVFQSNETLNDDQKILLTAYTNPQNLKEEDLQFNETRKTFFEPEMQFIIKRQPQFFVTDSVVEYSKLITKFTPEAITAMVEDGFLEVTQKYIPGKCR